MPRHVRKGDNVIVTAGNFRGAVGEIVRVDGDNERVFVKFPNAVYDGVKRKPLVKTLKPTRVNPQGGQVALDRSFHLSNVSPVVDGKASRVRFPVKNDGSKARVAVKSGKELSLVRGPKARAPKKA
ncbi:MAG: 50S ribosomal protein L24 [Phycisphaeraceae bacterium]|nr:50S ribosomal protein L24 [Phycisphaeraceae bacterium]